MQKLLDKLRIVHAKLWKYKDNSYPLYICTELIETHTSEEILYNTYKLLEKEYPLFVKWIELKGKEMNHDYKFGNPWTIDVESEQYPSNEDKYHELTKFIKYLELKIELKDGKNL